MRRDIKHGLIRFFLAQILVLGFVSIVFFITNGLMGLRSSLLGGVVSILPGLLFSLKLFKYQGAQQAKKIMNSLYTGEAYKLIVSGALFALVFIYIKVNALAFFLTYIIVQAVYWCAPWLIVKK